jgi:hypothetical protein
MLIVVAIPCAWAGADASRAELQGLQQNAAVDQRQLGKIAQSLQMRRSKMK